MLSGQWLATLPPETLSLDQSRILVWVEDILVERSNVSNMGTRSLGLNSHFYQVQLVIGDLVRIQEISREVKKVMDKDFVW